MILWGDFGPSLVEQSVVPEKAFNRDKKWILDIFGKGHRIVRRKDVVENENKWIYCVGEFEAQLELWSFDA